MSATHETNREGSPSVDGGARGSKAGPGTRPAKKLDGAAAGAAPRRFLPALGLLAGVLVTSFYFLQSSTLGPNHTDEGLLLGYVDDMAHGMRPFFDFVDAYGIFNWVFPVLFYKAAGYRVFGIRIWMVVLKVVTVVVTYVFARALCAEPERPEAEEAPAGRPLSGGRFYALLAAFLMTMLLGAQWQSLQTPYAFVTVIPLVIGCWYFVLAGPFRKGLWNVLAAAVCTTLAIWTKLNTGMYLLAGVLFAYFFWIPVKLRTSEPKKTDPRLRLLFRNAQWLGALAYGVLFTGYIRHYFNVWFFLYLTVPLLLGLGWTLVVKFRAPDDEHERRYTEPFVVYGLSTAALSLAVLYGYYGRQAGVYTKELAGILSSIKYTAPFPPLGERSYYLGLNDYYWLQIPWVLTALFALWIAFSRRMGPRGWGSAWPVRRAQISALFLLATLHGFVMYARCDETHIYQFLVLAAPVVVVVLAQLDAFVRAYRPTSQSILRFAIVAFTPVYAASIFVVPSFDALALDVGDWHNPKLEFLKYRREKSPYVRDYSPDISDHDWDIIEDDAAEYVRRVSDPGEEMLLLTANRLIHLNSDTRPIGGRYHFYFYLASVGLLDRAGFDRLVPPEVVLEILNHPPRIIVAALGHVPLADVFPELRRLRDTRYAITQTYRHILVYELEN